MLAEGVSCSGKRKVNRENGSCSVRHQIMYGTIWKDPEINLVYVWEMFPLNYWIDNIFTWFARYSLVQELDT